MFDKRFRNSFGRKLLPHHSRQHRPHLSIEPLEARLVPTAEFNGPMPDWINVKTDSHLSLHAIGNGITDDTSALQAALNYAVSNPAYTSTGTVYIPAGTYKISRPLWVWGGQSIQIIGADPTSTIISWAGPSGGTLFHFNGSRDSAVERLTLEGNNTAGDLLYLDWNAKLAAPAGVYTKNNLQYAGPNQIADVYFKDAEVGIQGGTYSGGAVAETSIERCQFTSTHNGVFVDNFNSLDWWIEGCTFKNNDGAIGTIATTGSVPSKWNFGAGNFEVSNSTFVHSTTADFVVGNLSGPVVIENCFSTDSNRFLFEYGPFRNAYNITIEGTTILDPATNAIHLHNFTPLTLLDNTFRTNTAPIKMDASWADGKQVAAAQVLSVGNKYSTAASATFTGAYSQLVSLSDQFDANLSGISSTPPPPVAPLPYVNRPIIALSAGATGIDIQNAIDTAVAKYSGQRPIVYLPAGQYKVASTIVIPAGADVQIVGDSSWDEHGSELIWTGAAGGTLLELKGPSHAILRDISFNAQAKSGTLIQVDNADQSGARVFADNFRNDGVLKGAGVWSDQLDNTLVQLLNSGPEGVNVTGGPLASTTGTAAGSTILEFSAGSANSSFNTQYSVSNGGNLFIDGLWWEGQANTPLFDLTGSGHLTVASVMLGYYGSSTANNSIELHNFTGSATFLNMTLNNTDLTHLLKNTGVLADGSAPTQVLLADSSSGMPQPLANNLTSSSANAVALDNTDFRSDGTSITSANQGTYTAAWLESMLATVRDTPPLQDPTTDLASGVTDVQLYNVATWQGGTTGLHIEGAQTGGSSTPPVAKSTPSVSVNPVNITYGTALSNKQLSGSATYVVHGSTVSVAGTYSYTSVAGKVLGAGNGQSEQITFIPTDTTDYNTVQTTATVNVAKGSPTVSVNPVNITYDMALSNSQLSGTATYVVNGSTVSVAGTYSYTSAAGKMLGAGNGQSEQVTFIPTDATDYSSVQATATVNVAQGMPTVSVNPVNITYGTALSNGQLSGSATYVVNGSTINVAGIYAYTSIAGTVLHVGNGQSEGVTFTPTDTTDYSTIRTTATVNVALSTSIRLTLQPSEASITAGNVVSYHLDVIGANGLPISNFTGTIRVTCTDPNATVQADYTFEPSNDGSISIPIRFRTSGTQEINVNVVGTGTSAQASTMVTPSYAHQVTLIGVPSQVTVNAPFRFQAAIEDVYGNLVPTFTGTVHFSSGGSKDTLPAAYTFKPSDNGVHWFTATFGEVGKGSLQVNDNADHLVFARNFIEVVAPTPSIIGPLTGTMGQLLTYDFSLTEPGVSNSTGFEYITSWGDGSGLQFSSGGPQGVTGSHAFTAAGQYVVRTMISDPFGNLSDTATFTVTITA